MHRLSSFKKYGFLWVTLGFFLVSFSGHWWLAWHAFQQQQAAHDEPVEVREFLAEVGRDTLENWQSEFLQLMWQVAGLAFLFHVGSPQSKDGDERKEAKIDRILEAVDRENGARILEEIDRRFPRK